MIWFGIIFAFILGIIAHAEWGPTHCKCCEWSLDQKIAEKLVKE